MSDTTRTSVPATRGHDEDARTGVGAGLDVSNMPPEGVVEIHDDDDDLLDPDEKPGA